jgi:hypothetical protein
MKRLLILMLLMVGALGACNETEDPTVLPQLSEAELETLLFTREEEKLAHDVYVYAYSKYGNRVFDNIAASESQHVNAILNSMENFNVDDPLNGSETPGEFTITALQTLYRDLIARVNQSTSESLIVGLYIEDLDIRDLDQAISETDEPSLIQVYENLKCGSKNHMRSFESLASDVGITYSPEFISQSEYEAIINSPRTSCNPS